MKIFRPPYRMLRVGIALFLFILRNVVIQKTVKVDAFSIFIRWVFILFFLWRWVRDCIRYNNQKKIKDYWLEIKGIVTRVENINKIWYKETKFWHMWDNERCYKIFAKYEDKEYESDTFIVTPKVSDVIGWVVKVWDKVSIYLDQNDPNKYYMDLNIEKIETESRKIILEKEWEKRNATVKFKS